MMVILRPGPYICSEWDFGGLPAWLLCKPGLRIRCSNPQYLDAVDRYFDVLLPRLKRLQWTQGGPVVLMQIENEYGVVGNDSAYLKHLYQRFREAGIDVPLFISDWGDSYTMQCGSIPETMITVNCPSHPGRHLDAVREFRPDTPEFIMELWCGVSHRWNTPYLKHNVDDVANDVGGDAHAGQLLQLLYVSRWNKLWIHARSSVFQRTFRALPQYLRCGCAARRGGESDPEIFCHSETDQTILPGCGNGNSRALPTAGIPPVKFAESAELFAQLDALSETFDSVTPEPMEYYGQNYGFILYRTDLDFIGESGTVSLENLADKGWIYLDGKLYGTTDSNRNTGTVVPPGKLAVLVENQGRINTGMGETTSWNKGLTGVLLDPRRRLYHWQVNPLPMKDLSRVEFGPYNPQPQGPCFHRAEFTIDFPADTYLRIPCGTHGQVFLNGFNLGRYRVEGPQYALFISRRIVEKRRK
ncbi:MAG: beta-galactosidase [Lentisphaeria bacterium]|nr:MAG: beta-galactosidase [Lentisphaeria bacterium]